MDNNKTKDLQAKKLQILLQAHNQVMGVKQEPKPKMEFPVDGKYLNQFHKESTERSLRYLEERKKRPIDLEREYRVHREISQMGRNKSDENPKTE